MTAAATDGATPPPSTSLEDVFHDIARVARALGCEDEGEELLAGLRVRMLTVHRTLKAAHAPRPRVAMLECIDPVLAGGPWVPEMIRRAGGVDVLAPGGGHSRVAALPDVAAARPDVVLVAPRGGGLAHAADEARRLVAAPEWTSAAPCEVWAIDGGALASRPGPWLVDGIEVMARIFNPSLFSRVAASSAICVSSSSRAGPPPASAAPQRPASATTR